MGGGDGRVVVADDGQVLRHDQPPVPGGGQFLGANAVFTTGADQVSLTDGFGSPYLAFAQGGLQGSATLTFSAAAVPEPESYALMLGGLGIVGFLARRRKAA